jgi:16S rRNA (guanine966-N2)-methyltransferase
MRIISGSHKGRQINPPKNLPVRPTTDMNKESLFNILNNHFHFQDLSVLDLFTGTGNISYEFSSRGVQNVTSVDQDFKCVAFVKKTAAEFEFPITAVKGSVFEFLEKTGATFDIIFADPPYDMDDSKFAKIAEIVFSRNLLEPGGILIIEHSKHTKLENAEHLSFQKKYGGSVFSFFEKEEEDDEDENEL